MFFGDFWAPKSLRVSRSKVEGIRLNWVTKKTGSISEFNVMPGIWPRDPSGSLILVDGFVVL